MPDPALPVARPTGALFDRTYRDAGGRPLLGEVSFVGDDGVPFSQPLVDGRVRAILLPGRYVVTERTRTADDVPLPRSTSIFLAGT